MKTPREVLLSRHQGAKSRLDTVRLNALKEVNQKEMKEQRHNLASLFLYCPQTVWRELIFPARRIWAGFAVIWLVIIVINASQSDHSSLITTAENKNSPGSTFAAWREQQKILAELNGLPEPPDAEKPKTFTPKPHSERAKLRSSV